MRPVAITGVGQTPVREHWDVGLRELAVQAIWAALEDAADPKVEALFVGNMLSGMMASQEHLAVLIADYAGLRGIEAVKVELACASGAAAFRQAVLAVASGAVRTAVAVGVEKLTERSIHATTEGLASAADADYEAAMGISFVALNALLMRRYMHEYGYQKSDFAPFVQLAHENAQANPNALFHFEVGRDQYEKSRMVADPICLLDSSPVADGAAAVVITAEETRAAGPQIPVWVHACEIGTDTIALDNRKDPLWMKGVEVSTRKALQRASLDHSRIRLFELHDAFSIMSALSLESAGFAEQGQAVRLANEGIFQLTGRLPMATAGGLKARGHPVGATGIYQIVEAVLQFQQRAPQPLQLEGVEYAMTQNIGGSGASVVTTILGRNKP
ncbi:MAG: thiolase domain-containing protein [Calditrichaeota bacterium]|nr:MAG: thiolase domain-containing protein [Calditrichota bacterium]